MNNEVSISDGDFCRVIAGTHIGKVGRVSDSKVSKSGALTITVTQDNGARFKTLARNAERIAPYVGSNDFSPDENRPG